jgi:hypothetical protein
LALRRADDSYRPGDLEPLIGSLVPAGGFRALDVGCVVSRLGQAGDTAENQGLALVCALRV